MGDDNIEKSPRPVGYGNPPHRWKKGKSPNPGGRPKDLKIIKDFARSKSMDVMRMLYDIAMDTSQKPVSRIAAGDILLNRGYGKVSQEVVVKGTGKDGQIEMTHMAKVLDTHELRVWQKMLLKANTALIEGTVSAVLEDSEDKVIDVEPEPSGEGPDKGGDDLEGYE